MKKLFIIGTLFFAVTSCGGGCDTSTAEGAAQCGCEYTTEFMNALSANDEAKMKEIETKMSTWESEVEKNMEAGKYTENDIEAAMQNIDGCELH